MQEATDFLHLNPQRFLKLLHKLLLQHIAQMAYTRKIVPMEQPNFYQPEHSSLTQYHTRKKYLHFENIINLHFFLDQLHNTKFIPAPFLLFLKQIFIEECNREKNIIAIISFIQIQNELS